MELMLITSREQWVNLTPWVFFQGTQPPGHSAIMPA